MSAWTMQRTSAGKASWIIVLVLLAWVVFLFAPFPLRQKPAPTSSLPPVAAQSKLESVGLANNPDWLGLPDYFAVWAGSIDWVEDRAYFAYWNPGSHSYSYFFEAIRAGDKVTFRSLPTKPVIDHLILDDDELAEYAKDRKGDSPTDPFVFAVKLPAPVTLPAQWSPGSAFAEKPIEKVDLKPAPQPIPPPSVKFPQKSDVEPKK